MKLIPTKEAVGHVLCHDLTQIIPGQYKGARFRKGHVVTEEDIPVLLSMGKEHLYVWEMEPGILHENDAAARLVKLCRGPGMIQSEVREGKIELRAERDGLFRVDTARLNAVNAIDELMIATRKGNTAVKAGDKLCGTRVIPLVIREEKLRAAEAAPHHPEEAAIRSDRRLARAVQVGGIVDRGIHRRILRPFADKRHHPLEVDDHAARPVRDELDVERDVHRERRGNRLVRQSPGKDVRKRRKVERRKRRAGQVHRPADVLRRGLLRRPRHHDRGGRERRRDALADRRPAVRLLRARGAQRLDDAVRLGTDPFERRGTP